MRRALQLLFSAVLLLTALMPPAAAEQSPLVKTTAQPLTGPEGEYMLLSTAGDRTLWVNLETGNTAVYNSRTGTYWHTAPVDLDAEQGISRDMQNYMNSHLAVTYLSEARNEVTVNSAACITDGTYEIVKVKNGFKITYDFSSGEARFKIPLELTLSADYLQARILYAEIEEYGKSCVTNIELLPWFGAGRADEDGYLFLPDGGGAVVNFADNTRDAPDWRQPVYGGDPAVNLLLKSADPSETVRMPIFGIKKSDTAMLAVIHEGDAAAHIFAASNSRNAPYAGAGCSFVYHQSDLTGIRDKTSTLRAIVITQKEPLEIMPTVRYYFLDGDDADCSGMARRYRRYLEEEKELKRQEVSYFATVALQFYGRTDKPSNFLGIPIRKALTATTFGQIVGLLSEINTKNPDILLYGFEKGGYENKYRPKQTFDKKTGGKKGYGGLLSATNGMVFTAYDLLRDYSGSLFGGGYIQGLNKVTVERRRPMLSTGDWDYDGPAWKYKNTVALKAGLEKLLKSVSGSKNAGIMLRRLGDEAASDFNTKTPADRTQTIKTYTQMLKWAGEYGCVSVDGGNIYAAPYVNLITGIPMKSSGHAIVSFDVPFYAMVLHGYVRLASQPLNNAPDRDAALLSLLIAGVAPSYRLTGAGMTELADTALDFLYNTKMSRWTQEIRETARRYGELQEGLGNIPIRSYEQKGELIVVTYENGVILAANMGDEPIEYENISIVPKTAVKISDL